MLHLLAMIGVARLQELSVLQLQHHLPGSNLVSNKVSSPENRFPVGHLDAPPA